MPQLRQNIITGEWVVIAPERAKRPQDFMIPKSVKVSDKTKCPFCEGTEGYKQNEKVRKASTKNIYVIENRFPAFVEEENKATVRSFYPESGFYRARPSIGDHEVVVIKDHDQILPRFSQELMCELLEVLRDRYIWINEHEKVTYIMPIYNHGAEAGASIEHPHAQIFASQVVANTVGREIEGADRYFGINGACVFCDIIRHEKKEKVRVVYENNDFISITFFAARFPFETWIYPKKHESQFELTSNHSMKQFSEALSKTLRAIDKTIDNPPLNMYIHTLPTTTSDSACFHWHLEIIPRVSNYGGFELGSDVIIDVMSPEEAADYLKEGKRKQNGSK